MGGAPRDKAKNTEIEHLINIKDPDGSLILIQMEKGGKTIENKDLLDASFSSSATNVEDNVEEIKVPLPVDSLEHEKIEDQDNQYMDLMENREDQGEENMDLLKSMDDTAKDSIDLLENMEEHAEESVDLLEYENMQKNIEESMDLLEHGSSEKTAEESMDFSEHVSMEENAEESTTNTPRDALSDIIDDIYEDTNLSKKHKKSKITKNRNKSSK